MYVYPFSQRLRFVVDYAATIVNCQGLFFNFKSFTVLYCISYSVQFLLFIVMQCNLCFQENQEFHTKITQIELKIFVVHVLFITFNILFLLLKLVLKSTKSPLWTLSTYQHIVLLMVPAKWFGSNCCSDQVWVLRRAASTHSILRHPLVEVP